MHQLINTINPICLYCQGTLNSKSVSLESIWLNHNILTSIKDIYICQICKEIFQIFSTSKDNQDIEYDGFLFSCNNIYVFNDYYSNNFWIGYHYQIYDNVTEPLPVKIAAFVVNFTDKIKLFNKLRTYVLFY